MLEDVNDLSMPIDEVMAKHFDLDNFLTWTAANILMDNMDTDANNFYLYSPLNSDKWYILPWDYDGGWEKQRRSNSIRMYQSGVSNYWGSILHNRYFRKESHIEQLRAKVEQLHAQYINKEKVEAQIQKYKEATVPFLYRIPDVNYLSGRVEDYEQELDTIIQTPEAGVKRFLEDLEKPKPFYLNDVEETGDKLQFSWETSYDLQDDKLLYDFTIATDELYQNVVHHVAGLETPSLELNKLPDGRYYWKVMVSDSKGNTQSTFDYVFDPIEDEYYLGRELEVE